MTLQFISENVMVPHRLFTMYLVTILLYLHCLCYQARMQKSLLLRLKSHNFHCFQALKTLEGCSNLRVNMTRIHHPIQVLMGLVFLGLYLTLFQIMQILHLFEYRVSSASVGIFAMFLILIQQPALRFFKMPQLSLHHFQN